MGNANAAAISASTVYIRNLRRYGDRRGCVNAASRGWRMRWCITIRAYTCIWYMRRLQIEAAQTFHLPIWRFLMQPGRGGGMALPYLLLAVDDAYGRLMSLPSINMYAYSLLLLYMHADDDPAPDASVSSRWINYKCKTGYIFHTITLMIADRAGSGGENFIRVRWDILHDESWMQWVYNDT